MSIGNSGDAAKPSKIKFQNSASSSSSSNGNQTVQVAISSDPEEKTHQTIYYKMYLRNPGDSIIVSISNAESSLRHVLYIRDSAHPTEVDYDWMKVVESEHWLSSEAFQVMVDADLFPEPTVVYVGIVMTSG